MLLKGLLKLGKQEKVIQYLRNAPFYFVYKKDKYEKEFLKLYFDCSFIDKGICICEIFDFLPAYNIDEASIAILIQSKYFNTLPQEFICSVLRRGDMRYSYSICDDSVLIKLAPFVRFLFSRVVDAKKFIEENKDEKHVLMHYFGYGIEEILLEARDLSFIADFSLYINPKNKKEYFNYFSKNLSLEEFREVCLKVPFMFDAGELCDILFTNYMGNRTQVLELLFEVMMKKKSEYSVVSLKTKKEIPFFNQCVNELDIREDVTEKDINYLALRLAESKNYPKMLEWLPNIDCENNKMIIDALVGHATEFILLYSVSNSFVNYALQKILEDGEKKAINISDTIDRIFLGIHEEEKLKCILDSLYARKLELKFSKNTTICLLKRGVDRFPELLFLYELTEEERMDILEELREINSEWLIIYGSYLLNGKKYTAIDYASGKDVRMRLRKLNKEENVKS